MTAPKPVEDQRDRQASSSNLPVPDPTVQTTQLVDRALAAYREVVDTRLNAMDKAVELVAAELTLARHQAITAATHRHDDLDRHLISLREILTAAIGNVSEVTGEKFAAVDTRFLERDTRTEQAAQESRISLDAALAAAKEAVSEQNKANTDKISTAGEVTQRQIDAIQTLMSTAIKALEDKITDLKGRLDRGEGRDTGGSDARTDQRLNIGQVLLALSVVIAMAGVIVAIVVSRA